MRPHSLRRSQLLGCLGFRFQAEASEAQKSMWPTGLGACEMSAAQDGRVGSLLYSGT